MWNHGSEPQPSAGTWLQDEIARAWQAGGRAAAQRTMIRLHETEHLDDQLAGLACAKQVPGVDPMRRVVAGCSHGGIQTLRAAERGAG